jgi:tetratricopeptide (TPR) repeat protein
MVCVHQGRHADSLAAYDRAREIYEQLGEPLSMALVWRLIGVTHETAGGFDAAEEAVHRAYALVVQQGDRLGEAGILNRLGNLNVTMGRLEEAARYLRESATLFGALGHGLGEGVARSNLADALVDLERYDEARGELAQAFACKNPIGHAAEAWKSFAILSKLERAVGNVAAATSARQRAFDAYLAYRREGGASTSPRQNIIDWFGRALMDGSPDTATSLLDEISRDPLLSNFMNHTLAALQAILAGSRDPALAANPDLDYQDAAELTLLLESLPLP